MRVRQEARKSYIGLVNDATEEERFADTATSQGRVRSYLVGRLAAVLKRPCKAAPERAVAP